LICQAKYGDVLYVKYKYTPVLASPNQEKPGIYDFLHKGYIVIEQSNSGNYTNVKLTNNDY
jgi:hypothetical protein